MVQYNIYLSCRAWYNIEQVLVQIQCTEKRPSIGIHPNLYQWKEVGIAPKWSKSALWAFHYERTRVMDRWKCKRKTLRTQVQGEQMHRIDWCLIDYEFRFLSDGSLYELGRGEWLKDLHHANHFPITRSLASIALGPKVLPHISQQHCLFSWIRREIDVHRMISPWSKREIWRKKSKASPGLHLCPVYLGVQYQCDQKKYSQSWWIIHTSQLIFFCHCKPWNDDYHSTISKLGLLVLDTYKRKKLWNFPLQIYDICSQCVQEPASYQYYIADCK